MTDDLSVSVRNLREVVDYINGLSTESFPKVKTVFRQSMMRVDAKIKDNATNILKVRTGNLKRSFMFDVGGTDVHNLRASVYSASVVGGSPVIYAPIHEYGGTINAIDKYMGVPGGPYLNIPAPANKTAAGVTRLKAWEVFNAGGFIGGKTVFNSEGVPMFWLTKSVTIRPRLGMLEAAEGDIPTLLSDLVSVIGDD